MKLLLLGTAGCHLCEQAEAILHDCAVHKSGWFVELIDIAEHDEQWQDYAIRIPVLYHVGSQTALCWPFTQTDVLSFLDSTNKTSRTLS